MTTEQQSVLDAEAHLERAKAAHAAKQREEDTKKLRQAVSDGRKALDEFRSLEKQFQKADASATLREQELSGLNAQIEANKRDRPTLSDLPTEAEIAAHDGALARLVASRDRVLGELSEARTIRDRLRVSAMAAARSVENQRRVVANLQSKMEGTLGETPKSSVSRVL